MPLLTDGDIATGVLGRKRILLSLLRGEYVELPEPVYRYAVKISKITGLPLEEVIKSKPVQNMLQKWSKKVVVRLD